MKQAAVHIGIQTLELYIPASNSLKTKRRVLKSFKDRIKHKFNVSISEIAEHDKWQRALLGVAMISNDKALIEKVFGDLCHLAGTLPEAELLHHGVEFV